VPASELPLPDRGLDYGDGVFETLLLKQGIPVRPALHLDRLRCGLEVLSIPDCVAAVNEQLKSAALEVQAAGWQWASLRLSVTRGAGPRGYTPPENPVPRVLAQIAELDHDAAVMPAAAVLSLSCVRLSSQPLLAGIKHLNRLEQVLAATQAQRDGVDESVLLDQSGNVVSAIAGNLFVLRDDALITPPLTHCGVAGTRRRLIMETLAPALGIEVLELVLSLPELESAQEVFYCNSLRGMRPVASLGARQWDNHPVCEALFEQYLRELP
jgi:4-amino-4-deoxychorismate lyase